MNKPHAPSSHRGRLGKLVFALTVCGIAAATARWGAAQAPSAEVRVGQRLFAPGEAFDGEELPLDSQPSKADAQGNLALRRFCSWGRPGRMPYRGTVEQALRAAGVPTALRARLAAAVATGRPDDRLVIANDAIQAVGSGRVFDERSFSMTYGKTLCEETRVNFRKGHTEAASLYEATDTDGMRYSVMVPDVCGNVSLIHPRRSSSERNMRDPGAQAPAASEPQANEVPAPGTLPLASIALTVLAATLRRRTDKRA